MRSATYVGGPAAIAAVIAAVVMSTAGRAEADDTLRLDPVTAQFDRKLPSSHPFTLDVPMPGKEAVHGEIEIWPAQDCDGASPGERQHYHLAMTATGSDADRVLRAQIPALQVNTSFCFRLQIVRGLDEAAGIGFAGRVVAAVSSATVLDAVCRSVEPTEQLATAVREAVVSVANQESEAVSASYRQRGHRAEPTPDAAAADAIARATLGGIDARVLCQDLLRADAAATLAGDLAVRASRDLERALAVVLPLGSPSNLLALHPVRAPLPLLITGAPPYQITHFAQAADDDALITPAVQMLEPVAPALAQLLREIAAAAAADRPQKRRRYLDELAKLPAMPAVLAYGTDLRAAPIDELFRVVARGSEPVAALRGDIVARRGQVLASVDLLERQLAVIARRDDRGADAWVAALEAIRVADAAARAASSDVKARADALDTARGAIVSRLRERLAAADVRALVQRVSRIDLQSQVTASQTDEGAASVSPDVGVLVAFPLGNHDLRDGWRPWFVPYAGVNLYAERVDRVVPFDQLVGSWARQRLSLTAGALLTRPEVNGAKVTLPFHDTGIIPVVALGARLSSFTRASIGGLVFQYRDANPASAQQHTALAVWFGLSIDADVWAAVQGKAFR